MSVRKRFYTKEIMDLIIQKIDKNTDLDFVKTVMEGNLSLVPDMKNYTKYFPAIFIEPTDIFNDTSIGNKSIMPSKYMFNICYVQYDDRMEDVNLKAVSLENGELIASTLLEDENLNRARLKEGMILQTDVPHIELDDSMENVFRTLQLPIHSVKIEYDVYFRSFIRR